MLRGVRGAVMAAANTREDILSATRELLGALIEANDIRLEDVVTVFFTVTADLHAEHPALAARQLGWVHVPLLCMQEMAVPSGLPRVVRVLIQWHTERSASEVRFVYLREAEALRPDLSETER